jgi:hypothetical protein
LNSFPDPVPPGNIISDVFFEALHKVVELGSLALTSTVALFAFKP